MAREAELLHKLGLELKQYQENFHQAAKSARSVGVFNELIQTVNERIEELKKTLQGVQVDSSIALNNYNVSLVAYFNAHYQSMINITNPNTPQQVLINEDQYLQTLLDKLYGSSSFVKKRDIYEIQLNISKKNLEENLALFKEFSGKHTTELQAYTEKFKRNQQMCVYLASAVKRIRSGEIPNILE